MRSQLYDATTHGRCFTVAFRYFKYGEVSAPVRGRDSEVEDKVGK
jgi:hypothetical protein